MKSCFIMRLAAVAIAIIIVIASFSLAVSASALQTDGEIEYYGREALLTLDNGEAMVAAYDRIVIGVENCEKVISVAAPGVLTTEQIRTVWLSYRKDQAHHFWIGDSAIVLPTKVEPTYLMEKNELPAAKLAFEAAVSHMLEGVDEIDGDFEKELYLHDRLVRSVIYDLDAEYCHSAYGALVFGRAVCDGYSEAFQYLLHRAGIESVIVYGESRGVGHAWNIVKIDGDYYQVDATWNDQGDTTYHAYFNITDAQMNVDHDANETAYSLPICNSTEKNYFTVKGGSVSSLSELDINEIGEHMQNNGLGFHAFLEGVLTFNDYIGWYTENGNQNLRAVAEKAGIRGAFAYGYASLGNEVYIYLIPTDSSAHVTVTGVTVSESLSVGIGEAKTVVTAFLPVGAQAAEISFSSSDVSVAAVNAESGTVIGIGKGRAVIKVSAVVMDGYTVVATYTDTCIVTVSCDHENKTEHLAGTSTCTVAANAEYNTCDVCGQIFDADGETELDAIPMQPLGAHTFAQIEDDDCLKTSGTCKLKTVYYESCSVCGEKDLSQTFEGGYGDHAFGKSFENDEEHHWHECDCGARESKEGHKDKNGDGKCDTCGYKLPEVTADDQERTTEEAPKHTEGEEDKTTGLPSMTESEKTSEEKKPTDTEAPEITVKKPETVKSKGGCMRISATVQLVALFCIAVAAIIVKKK